MGAGSPQLAVVDGTSCPGGNSPVVLINVRNSSGGLNFTCSGTVVGARAVLTAGHCLSGAPSADVDLGGGNDVPGASLHVIPGYQSPGGSSSEDVAILVTAADLGRPTFPLLASRDAIVGEQAVVAGWGLDQNGVGATLRAGFNAISGVGPYFVQTQFAPGGSSSGLCKGDSGGPILVLQGTWAIAGVASSISGSCTAAGTDSFASVRNADIAGFIASLVPDLGRR